MNRSWKTKGDRSVVLAFETLLLAIPLFFLYYALVISMDDMMACAYDVWSPEDDGIRRRKILRAIIITNS